MSKGLFITIEGGEGAGKSTIIEMLKRDYKDFIFTREPGGIKIGEEIRNIILNNEMDSKTELLLFAAARREHLVRTILPNLLNGKTVICDRFIDSTLVYQGYGRELGIDNVMNINKFVTNDLMPDLTIYLDVDPKIGLERIHKNTSNEINRIDNEKMEFHNKIREGYKLLLTMFPERIKEIDANQPIDLVYRDIINLLQKIKCL